MLIDDTLNKNKKNYDCSEIKYNYKSFKYNSFRIYIILGLLINILLTIIYILQLENLKYI